MVKEVMEYLRCEPGKVYVDGTIGGGGHSLEILKRTSPDGQVIGIDWDRESVDLASRRLSNFKDRIHIFQDNFKNLDRILKELHIQAVDGIFLDLGLSSYQLKSGRGFSFMQDEPLDMRMGEARVTAYDLINHISVEELETILRQYGEERWAYRIAKCIVSARRVKSITTTKELADIARNAIPLKHRPRRIHPATKTFQAIRIAVNHELENVETFIGKGIDLLKQKGRICIISYHSLEDRIVKRGFRVGKEEKRLRIITPKPITPSPEELHLNPRARSAKLRVAEKL
ncbi:MAG TPA: 16S rRNA (cytosine(1402)-N(4))-methyltransferase RsmH, partial [Syntrophaceae bacterium]|nr:16S rRNA (cytosine(1402)-N(4))-methyltransferase RsmH [Syntrophaceae bacterium]